VAPRKWHEDLQASALHRRVRTAQGCAVSAPGRRAWNCCSMPSAVCARAAPQRPGDRAARAKRHTASRGASAGAANSRAGRAPTCMRRGGAMTPALQTSRSSGALRLLYAATHSRTLASELRSSRIASAVPAVQPGSGAAPSSAWQARQARVSLLRWRRRCHNNTGEQGCRLPQKTTQAGAHARKHHLHTACLAAILPHR